MDVWKANAGKIGKEGKVLAASQFNNSNGDSQFMPVNPKVFRHVWENPLLFLSFILTAIVFVASIVAMVMVSPLFSMIFLVPIAIYVVRAIRWGYFYSSSVMVSNEQFTDIWMMVNTASREYGCGVPDAFIVPGKGELKVSSYGHEHKRYMVISSDLMEMNGKGRNNSAVEFAIYHEMAHIAAGHRDYWRIVLTMVGRVFPVVGKALSRAESYTADSYAMVSCPQGVTPYMGAMTAGKYAGEMVDCTNVGGAGNSSPWVMVANALRRTPLFSWRLFAMTESVSGPKKGSLFLAPNK